ncbi:hypothetical protein DPX16_23471 [Anabarilius grahami]|uniref:Uncharacterized protein n=1 Tax=Anabarilius grahami TaxID=495550 RepID=A0A3N0Z0B4_ANAGA|nr:hypothetical protein DPX16_23471 [Anabarilius grahami]
MELKGTFSDETVNTDPRMSQRAASPEASCVSVKSNKSMDYPLRFSDGTVTSDPRGEDQTSKTKTIQDQRCGRDQTFQDQNQTIESR